ncbi:amidohydrolase family protein [Pseudonocardia sp. GCM10023141]|uniref:amidohydrolase family protein n=1 Tax=Pseudonocardia sp. GCM10023141 TaxID=3252653 RepID=UPI00361558D2
MPSSDVVVDACVYHEWTSTHDLAPYLSAGWRELLLKPTGVGPPAEVRTNPLYVDPFGAKDVNAYPVQGPPGSDLEFMVDQVLADGRRNRAVLCFDDGLLSTAYANHYVARVAARAANDWTIDQWLGRDERLHGLAMVASALPDEAAAEIRRIGANDHIVGVALGSSGFSKPFGHPVYHPIYQAAVEMALPVVIQASGENAGSVLTSPVAGGMPVTYAEYDALSWQPLMSHVASMITQGVFDLFPDLKVLLVGGGVSWVLGFLAKLDYWYKIDSQEATWLTRLPSEYFRDHFRVATVSMEAPPDTDRFKDALQTMSGMDEILMYASGYPNRGWEEPAAISARLPSDWQRNVMGRNAMEFFRWPGIARPARSAGVSRSSIAEVSVASPR